MARARPPRRGASGLTGSDGNGRQRNGDGPRPPEEAGLPRPWVPGPGWQRRHEPRIAARRRRRRLAWFLGAVGIALLGVSWLIAFTASVPRLKPTIGDDRFVEAANAICVPAKQRLVTIAPLRSQPTAEERAARVEETVADLAVMVGRLRELSPAPADADEVGRWFQSWDAYLASGRRLADAVRAGDDKAAVRAQEDGTPPARAVDTFARANGALACGTLR